MAIQKHRRGRHPNYHEAGLFGVKKQQFGRTKSAHGKKQVTKFNRDVYDPIKKQVVTVRRHTYTY